MKKLLLLPLLTLTLASVGCNNDSSAPSASADKTPETIKEKQAYSVGTRMAKSHKQVVDDITSVQGEFDIDMYVLGIKDTLMGTEKLDEETMGQISEDYRKEYLAKKRAAAEMKKAENKKVGVEFLAANKEREGVVALESGLQYKVLKEGEGKKPTKEDEVSVLYTGKLLDGTVFDSTSESKSPRQFRLGGVIPGWTEGLQLMNVGSKYEFYIPSELAYGERDSGKIPANSLLIFEVELLDIISKEKEEEKEAKAAK